MTKNGASNPRCPLRRDLLTKTMVMETNQYRETTPKMRVYLWKKKPKFEKTHDFFSFLLVKCIGMQLIFAKI